MCRSIGEHFSISAVVVANSPAARLDYPRWKNVREAGVFVSRDHAFDWLTFYPHVGSEGTFTAPKTFCVKPTELADDDCRR